MTTDPQTQAPELKADEEETQSSLFLADHGLSHLSPRVVAMGFRTIKDLIELKRELVGAASYPVPQLVEFFAKVDVLSACKLKSALLDLASGYAREVANLEVKYATRAEKQAKLEAEQAREALLEQDKLALLRCLEENPQWNNRLDWKKSYQDKHSLASWKCVEGSDRVTKLDLEGSKVAGKIPAAIGSLTMLKEINMNYCTVEGPLPESFANLVHLQGLYLRDTAVEGSAPAFLQSLPKLKNVEISCAEIPPDDRAALKAMCEENPQWNDRLGWLKSLEDGASFASFRGIEETGKDRVGSIVCTVDGLLGTVPPSIGKLTALKKLNLSGNKITGPLPDSLQNLTALESLKLAMTHIKEGAPAAVKALPRLKEIEISYQEEPPSFMW